MFRIDVTDFEFILALISPQQRLGGTNSIECVERLPLTLRYLVTDESFQSLSFQYRMWLNAVLYVVKGCCKAIVEWMASAFVKAPINKSWKVPHFKKFLRKMELSPHSGSNRWETYQNSEANKSWVLLLQLQTHSFHNFDGHRRSRIRMFVLLCKIQWKS